MDNVVNIASNNTYLNVNEVTTLTMMCVFGRLMSQLADVNTQSTVGM